MLTCEQINGFIKEKIRKTKNQGPCNQSRRIKTQDVATKHLESGRVPIYLENKIKIKGKDLSTMNLAYNEAKSQPPHMIVHQLFQP